MLIQENNCFLGIDTSNYTTSTAMIDDFGKIYNKRKLLEVKSGEKGLRQSEALFMHVKQFTEVYSMLPDINIRCIGVSTKPRNVLDSYMPCFLAGKSFAYTIGKTLSVPVYEFSHQQGHIAAGILSSESFCLLKKPFFAFHLSGGTTELLLINGLDDISIISHTLDITCGQLIDRTGVLLGLDFPAGIYLEKKAFGGNIPEKICIKLKDGNCCLSGFENKVHDFYSNNISACDICYFILNVVQKTIELMLLNARNKYGNLPCLFVGGVMSNKYIRNEIEKMGNVYFASAELSGDNAVGVAWLAKHSFENGNKI